HFDGWPRLIETHQLDPSQTTATTARGPLIHIYGAPGTGKTTVAVHSVLHRIRNNHRTPTECMLLTSSRVTATHARREVTRLLGTTTQRPLAASMQAFGFSILTRLARLNNTPPPRLLDGAEQDVILGELLTGHTTGHAPAPNWPHDITEALTTRGFRAELRDLIMRAVEYGISPEELANLGNQHNEPAWTAAADVLREYDNVTALSRPGAYDPSWILGAAAGALLDNPTNINLLSGGIRTLIIDDAQELTAAAATLLNTLHHNGIELVLIGDPDTATQTFRGADPHLFTSGWDGLTPTTCHTLNTRHRPIHAIAAVTTHITQNIGVTGTATHRHATPPPGPEPTTNTPPIDIIIANNTSAEEAHITALLRREHLLNGREWSDMAVIVRGSTRTAALRRAFSAAGIPTDIAGARLPLREETPVRTLLAIYEVAIHAAWAAAHNPTPENPTTTPQPTPQHLTTADLLALDETLTSHLLQSDTVTARRARRALTHHERTNGGTRA
ncbi:UvrD-helicase domain-containing protein, partial [Dermatophilus congolensis]